MTEETELRDKGAPFIANQKEISSWKEEEGRRLGKEKGSRPTYKGGTKEKNRFCRTAERAGIRENTVVTKGELG